MKNKNHRTRKQIRLKDYYYSSDGGYFVTICTREKECLFGDIKNGKMNLNKMGQMAEKFWKKIPDFFENVILDEFVIMPNHIHGIIFINNDPVGSPIYRDLNKESNYTDAMNRVPTGGTTGKNNPMGTKSLGEIIRWFKGRTTFEIHKKF